MRRAIPLTLALLASTHAFARGRLGPSDCKFFNALTFGSDRDSTDAAAFNKPFDFRDYGQASFHVIWTSLTGSVDGSCKVQVSLDGINWVDKSGATFNLVGATGSDVINVTSMPEAYYKVKCSHVSTTGGTLTGYCMAKD